MSSSSAIEGNEIIQRETGENENVSAQGVRTRSSYQAAVEAAAIVAQDRSRGRQSSRNARSSRSRSADREAARAEAKNSPTPSLKAASDRVAADTTVADEEDEELEWTAAALAKARVAAIIREKDRATRLARRVEELIAAQLAAADEARQADEEAAAQRAAAEMAMELQRRAAQAEQDEYEQQARAA